MGRLRWTYLIITNKTFHVSQKENLSPFGVWLPGFHKSKFVELFNSLNVVQSLPIFSVSLCLKSIFLVFIIFATEVRTKESERLKNSFCFIGILKPPYDDWLRVRLIISVNKMSELSVVFCMYHFCHRFKVELF